MRAMPLELSGRLVFWDGSQEMFTAQITPRVEDGCRVYVARVPIYYDAAGVPKLLSRFHVDVLPAHSTIELQLAT